MTELILVFKFFLYELHKCGAFKLKHAFNFRNEFELVVLIIEEIRIKSFVASWYCYSVLGEVGSKSMDFYKEASPPFLSYDIICIPFRFWVNNFFFWGLLFEFGLYIALFDWLRFIFLFKYKEFHSLSGFLFHHIILSLQILFIPAGKSERKMSGDISSDSGPSKLFDYFVKIFEIKLFLQIDNIYWTDAAIAVVIIETEHESQLHMIPVSEYVLYHAVEPDDVDVVLLWFEFGFLLLIDCLVNVLPPWSSPKHKFFVWHCKHHIEPDRNLFNIDAKYFIEPTDRWIAVHVKGKRIILSFRTDHWKLVKSTEQFEECGRPKMFSEFSQFGYFSVVNRDHF